MKKTLTIAGIILLTSCTVERTVVIEPATTQPPVTENRTTQPEISDLEREQSFLDFVEESFGNIDGLISEILDAGRTTCRNADWGWTAQDFAENAASVARTDESMRLLAAVIAGALNFLCPEHRFLLDDLDTAI